MQGQLKKPGINDFLLPSELIVTGFALSIQGRARYAGCTEHDGRIKPRPKGASPLIPYLKGLTLSYLRFRILFAHPAR